MYTIIHGDCLEELKKLDDNSIDAVICDPPYGLSNTKPKQVADVLAAWVTGDTKVVPAGKGFMGASWDGFVPPPAVWEECMRVLKPGGHMAVFAGARTQDLMGLSIRLAGFEIRDGLSWITGTGFPKGQDIGKQIDKMKGAKREVVGSGSAGAGFNPVKGFGSGVTTVGDKVSSQTWDVTAPATDEARRWDGWNTQLKPAQEPIVLARKPLDGTVAANVLAHGVGGLNIDACRVGSERRTYTPRLTKSDLLNDDGWEKIGTTAAAVSASGRFPANVLLDEHAAKEMDEQGGGASRFFPVFKYQAKAPKKERPVIERPPMLQLRDDLTPEQVDHVRARLQEAGIEIE